MNIASVAGAALLGQVANQMSTQMALLRISADADQSVVAMLKQASGEAQAPSQAVTPAAAAGKGAVVDVLV